MRKKTSDKKRSVSPDYYQHLIENSQDVLYSLNSQTGQFDYMSPAVMAILGFTPKEAIEMGTEGLNQRMPSEYRQTMDKYAADSKKKKLPPNCVSYVETKFKHKKGHYVWLGISRNFITNSRGDIKMSVGNIRDITETKLLQQQLESSLENYKKLYHNAQASLYRTRLSDGKMLECNESMAKMLGYENREQCLAKHYSKEHYANSRRRSEFIKLLEERGYVDSFEAEARRVDGSLLWAKISAQSYPEKDYLEGTIWDITASKILTPAENQILEQIMHGKSNKEIAFRLKRSTRTIEDHRSHIMQKLGTHNLVELIQKITKAGIEP